MQGRHPKVRKARLCPHFRCPTLSRCHLTLVPKHSAGRQMCSARRTRVRTTDSGMRQTPVNSHLQLQQMRPLKADTAGGGLSLCGGRRAAPRGAPPLAAGLSLPPSHAPAPAFPSQPHGLQTSLGATIQPDGHRPGRAHAPRPAFTARRAYFLLKETWPPKPRPSGLHGGLRSSLSSCPLFDRPPDKASLRTRYPSDETAPLPSLGAATEERGRGGAPGTRRRPQRKPRPSSARRLPRRVLRVGNLSHGRARAGGDDARGPGLLRRGVHGRQARGPPAPDSLRRQLRCPERDWRRDWPAAQETLDCAHFCQGEPPGESQALQTPVLPSARWRGDGRDRAPERTACPSRASPATPTARAFAEAALSVSEAWPGRDAAQVCASGQQTGHRDRVLSCVRAPSAPDAEPRSPARFPSDRPGHARCRRCSRPSRKPHRRVDSASGGSSRVGSEDGDTAVTPGKPAAGGTARAQPLAPGLSAGRPEWVLR